VEHYYPKQRQCPYCDSKKIQAMPVRDPMYEAKSSVTWYECHACKRIWHREKPPQTPLSTPDRSPDTE